MSRREFTGLAAAATLGASVPALSQAPPPAAESLASLTLTEAARRLRSGEITSVALVTACLDRIHQLNPKVNAFITVMRDGALAQAAETDRNARAGRFAGPLHGLPISLKDNIDTVAARTTGGSAVYENRFPKEDAEVVRRLLSAGAILLGKTNLQEFAMGGSSVSTYFLPVRNPWALERIPAGSSGGSAAAVIADLTIAAVGTDTGGSVRMPAAYCGIVGLKPTYGLVSIRGIIPRTYSLDHCGPMTKTVEDNALLLNAMTGYDKLDVASVEHGREDYVAACRQPVSALRIGIPRAPFFDRLHPEISSAIEQAIGVIGRLTQGTRDVHLPSEGTYSRALLGGEIEAYHWELYKRNADRYSMNQRETIASNHKALNDTAMEPCSERVVDYVIANWELIRLRKTIDDAFSTFDLVVLPTMRDLPPTIDEALSSEEDPKPHEPRDASNCSWFNTFGIPAVSMPCGFSASGLPIGMMIAGPRFSEGRVLALANAYEKATEWHLRRPKLSADMAVPAMHRKS
ncbi:MAG: amidase [Acidobacteriota bacterium]|nr:amidase [Acidobacteriota bacterium]